MCIILMFNIYDDSAEQYNGFGLCDATMPSIDQTGNWSPSDVFSFCESPVQSTGYKASHSMLLAGFEVGPPTTPPERPRASAPPLVTACELPMSLGSPVMCFSPGHVSISSSECSPPEVGDANMNPRLHSVVAVRQAYGKGPESKENSPHPFDNYVFDGGRSYTALCAVLADPATGRTPGSGPMRKAFTKLVEGIPVDRACKRRLPNMYGWLDEHWDSIGARAIEVFREYFGK